MYNADEIANYFAMCLLMPEKEYKKIFEENLINNGKHVNTKKIAEYFNVSINLATQRGVDLGLISKW